MCGAGGGNTLRAFYQVATHCNKKHHVHKFSWKAWPTEMPGTHPYCVGVNTWPYDRGMIFSKANCKLKGWTHYFNFWAFSTPKPNTEVLCSAYTNRGGVIRSWAAKKPKCTGWEKKYGLSAHLTWYAPLDTFAFDTPQMYCMGAKGSGSKRDLRAKFAMTSNCDGDGWKHSLSWQAYPVQKTGTAAYCVGQSTTPYERYSIQKKATCNGGDWSHVFTFWAYPTSVANSQVHCWAYTDWGAARRFWIAQQSSCGSSSWKKKYGFVHYGVFYTPK